MMKSLCGTDCCSRCSRQAECGGCQSVKGHPFGGNCIAAECVKQSGEEGFQRLKEKDALEFFQQPLQLFRQFFCGSGAP